MHRAFGRARQRAFGQPVDGPFSAGMGQAGKKRAAVPEHLPGERTGENIQRPRGDGRAIAAMAFQNAADVGNLPRLPCGIVAVRRQTEAVHGHQRHHLTRRCVSSRQRRPEQLQSGERATLHVHRHKTGGLISAVRISRNDAGNIVQIAAKPRRRQPVLPVNDPQGAVRAAGDRQRVKQRPIPEHRDLADKALAGRCIDRTLIARVDIKVADAAILKAGPKPERRIDLDPRGRLPAHAAFLPASRSAASRAFARSMPNSTVV